MYWAPASSAIRCRTGLGKTSDPKIAGTSSALIWSMSEATSCAVGSAKSEGYIAPITVHPYSRAKYGNESW